MLTDMIGTLSFLSLRADDDFVDRLHYFYTTTFLIIMSLLVSFKMFAGKPLECWLPAEYKNSWEQYAEQYCWAQNTYYVPQTEQIPNDIDQRNQYISYYQWVPFFFLIQAGCFYFPCLLWRMFNNKSGLDMQKIVAVAKTPDNIHLEERHKNIQSLALYLESVFARQYRMSSNHSTLHRFMKCFNIRYYESFVSILYIIVKALYMINVVGQLFFLNWFLQTDDYTFYGAGVISDLAQGKPWESSGNFPRVSLCDLTIRRLANEHRYTVQCVLVLNIFTEKIFALLWLWFAVLVVLTAFNLVYWIFVTFLPSNRIDFVTRQLEFADTFNIQEKVKMRKFATEFLKMDGVFALRMLNLHAGILFTADLIQAMRELYDSWSVDAEEAMGFIENGQPPSFDQLLSADTNEQQQKDKRRRRTDSFLVPFAFQNHTRKSCAQLNDSDEDLAKPNRKFFKQP